jgi:hypothetical protein
MKYKSTTPVPNSVFDVVLPSLSGTELKLLLVVIRQTLGWISHVTPSGRKERDWLSSGLLQRKTGCSRRSISTAIHTLAEKDLIEIVGHAGNSLQNAGSRKGKSHLYFRISQRLYQDVNSLGITSEKPVENKSSTVFIAQDLRKNVLQLAQNLRTTK